VIKIRIGEVGEGGEAVRIYDFGWKKWDVKIILIFSTRK